MSSASNLGYGNIKPLSNVDGKFVNIDNSNSPSGFGSNENPAKLNVIKGGSKILKRKIKNITKQYKKMKAGSRKMKSIKKKLRSRAISRSRSRTGGKRMRKHSHTKKRHQRGGYAQYQNNLPMTPTYQVAGIHLPSSQLALANPPPVTKLSNCVNCVDNYSHFTNKGFPSRGH